jgi:transcriptional regulator with XRE-family HTH domain
MHDQPMHRSASSRHRAAQQSARIGEEVRLARVTLGWTHQDVARRSGVAWDTEVRVEDGDPGVGINTLCAVAGAVGLDLTVRAYPGKQPSLRDTGQLELAEVLRSQAHLSWQVQVEVIAGEHGRAIDLVLFRADEIVVTEIERMATDFQAQYRRANQKREALANQHRRSVRLVMAVEDTQRNRAALEPHRTFVASVLPAGSREILNAVRAGHALGRDGLLWIRRRPALPRSVSG